MHGPNTIYFAGDLFNHKDLIGNLLLAEAIEEQSGGDLRCVLPQNLEQTTGRSVDIRNQDLLEVLKADLILLNFDGLELDSGTVVEFLFAKMIDLPAVVLRSDFRAAGDQHREGDPWNLMCSGYPRTKILRINAMAWYQEAWREGGATSEVLRRYYQRLSRSVVDGFKEVRSQPGIHDSHAPGLEAIYQWARIFPGSGLDELLEDAELLALVERRLRH
ncbi:MAG: nucleoside 2-deoxyribosyltransferase [bacterium]|jgi:nucleoside 2-deoxyribosyltransferase